MRQPQNRKHRPFLARRALSWLLAGALTSLACSKPIPRPYFQEKAAEVGVDFVHFNGMSGERYFSEVVGSGVAIFDADNDGDVDLYFVQGSMLGSGKLLGDALTAPAPQMRPLHDRLYINQLAETGRLSFIDESARRGLHGATGYGMGVATGDLDNDGWTDLLVTNQGRNQLWRNTGDGFFEEVTEAAGVALVAEHWSTSAAFFDYDRDGFQDLFIANYVDYRAERHKGCLDRRGRSEYCGPHSYAPLADTLLRNRGDGTFVDVSDEVGIAASPGSGLGIVTADFNRDGSTDIYVANDLMRNTLWISQGDGTFANQALMSGAAVGEHGQAEASMGVDAADIDNDGDLDLFMTHLDGETNTLYINDGTGAFLDQTGRFGLAAPSVSATGFGTALLDVDQDGWHDVLVANGAVKSIATQRDRGETLPLRQNNQLYLNQNGSFVDRSDLVPAFASADVSRGLAVGDLDNDGRLDAVITNNNGSATVLLNESPRRPWVGLSFTDGRGVLPSDIAVRVGAQDGPLIRGGSTVSYCSARDPRIVIGLDRLGAPAAVDLFVEWPSGMVQHVEGLEPGRYHLIEETSR